MLCIVFAKYHLTVLNPLQSSHHVNAFCRPSAERGLSRSQQRPANINLRHSVSGTGAAHRHFATIHPNQHCQKPFSRRPCDRTGHGEVHFTNFESYADSITSCSVSVVQFVKGFVSKSYSSCQALADILQRSIMAWDGMSRL